jgi:hypothetical protein
VKATDFQGQPTYCGDVCCSLSHWIHISGNKACTAGCTSKSTCPCTILQLKHTAVQHTYRATQRILQYSPGLCEEVVNAQSLHLAPPHGLKVASNQTCHDITTSLRITPERPHGLSLRLCSDYRQVHASCLLGLHIRTHACLLAVKPYSVVHKGSGCLLGIFHFLPTLRVSSSCCTPGSSSRPRPALSVCEAKYRVMASCTAASLGIACKQHTLTHTTCWLGKL